MHTLELTLVVHSEIWEDKEKKDHQDKIEEALEIEGIHYISNTRPNRRGGGAAISLICEDFTLTKRDVLIPKNLELVWGLVRPKQPTTDFKGIIVCAFYSVPHSKRKTQLVEHIAINHGELKAVYKGFFFLTGGDKNDLEIKNILDISPNLHMHNTRPTHGKNNIDVLVSDMAHLYCEPNIIPNVPTDIPDGQPGGGKQSDHPIVFSRPRLERVSKPTKEVVIKKTRRFNDAIKNELGKWIQQESWEELYDSTNPAETFVEIVFNKLDQICPEEQVKITKLDGKVKSLALQKIGRQKLREYTNHGSSNCFKALKKKQKTRIKLEGQKSLDKLFENAGYKGTKWIREADRMSSRPGEDSFSTFSLSLLSLLSVSY